MRDAGTFSGLYRRLRKCLEFRAGCTPLIVAFSTSLSSSLFLRYRRSCLLSADTMNLRANPTPSQRQQRIENLAKQVVNLAVNPRRKAPRKQPRAAPRKKCRSAPFQSQRTAPTSSLHCEKRDKSASATESPSPPAIQNLPPPSTQSLLVLGVLDALDEYWNREEEELNGSIGDERSKVDDDKEDLDVGPRH